MRTKLYKWAALKIVPKIRFTTYYPKINGRQYHALWDAMLPGDIVLTIDHKQLTTAIIPGEFSHVGMCVSKDNKWEMVEMTHRDYVKTCLFDMAKASDRLVIMRPQLSQDIIDKAIEKSKSFEGTDYDSLFNFGVEELYCSELIYESYENNSLEIPTGDLFGLGKPYISPSGLYKAKKLKVVIDSDDVK